ncbi:LysM domain containing 3 [Homo sapiens]|uniref:Isoform 2 of LysM and putative peptidoglycan-binding domain-containing protein 3 n=1 Tax=Homo sapiens TaxID=9606 RepID=Q7Z3D4-2|eukprot:NP_001273741.1 lysM and putative peptidoglycan-binding domain-containing protein 3 isoform 2 [Homo sapiens]
MAGRHQNRSFPLPGVQSSGQVHAFGNCSDSDILEEDAEVYELRSRGKEKVRRSTSRDRLDDIIVLTKDIQEGDTLNAIALQYCCTVYQNSSKKVQFLDRNTLSSKRKTDFTSFICSILFRTTGNFAS